MALAVSSQSYHDVVLCHLRHRLLCFLAGFFTHPLSFLASLHASHAVISSSAALQLLFSLETSSWKANDLDLYVAFGQMSPLHDFLINAGFSRSNPPFSPAYSLGSIRTITTYHSENWKVNIIESRTHSPLSPIFEFHLSSSMNFISADSFFSTYPSLTARCCAIVNPMLFDLGNVRIGTLNALLKYCRRGFEIRSPAQYHLMSHRVGDPHNCGMSITCSETPRRSNDSYCLYLRVPGVVKQCDEHEEVFPLVKWQLGGQRCMRLGYVEPYIHIM
ncbi:hypothetical protein L210DRAFT_861889 [Boletus edulis BED1]|uniref:Uncharacterized protein n=1 Tax=Boletus edulis BED1 TaxID=1328754 RepID=A0AAD4BYM7_BOLED|nr:hypothetical protein L210DRAFT_861889 [Boletus edulis BED1]